MLFRRIVAPSLFRCFRVDQERRKAVASALPKGGLMESHQNESIKPIVVRVSHEQYRRLLDGATQFDLRFPWLALHRYLVCIATISDEGVWIKLG